MSRCRRTLEDALGEPACLLLPRHLTKDTIVPVGAIGRFFGGLFSFLGTPSTQEERVAAYVIREHDRGRSLTDILDDPYVRNRCSPQEIARLLDRPDVLKAIGDDTAEAAKQAARQGPARASSLSQLDHAAPRPRGPRRRARST